MTGYHNEYFIKFIDRTNQKEIFLGCLSGKLKCFGTECMKENQGEMSTNCIHVKKASKDKEILKYFKNKGYPVNLEHS